MSWHALIGFSNLEPGGEESGVWSVERLEKEGGRLDGALCPGISLE